MNRTRLIVIGVLALALGALASFSVYKHLESQSGADNAPGETVAVAANDLGVGSSIQEKDIKLVKFPPGTAPPGSFNNKTAVLGRGVVVPMAKGEFILPGKLAAEHAGSGLPGLIPTGMRAVSVRVNEVVQVAGFVQPGTRVDVLLTGNPGGGEQQTTTVLENVQVIAAGSRLERNSAGEAQMAPVITLLVSPEDAQKLTLASTEGRIQLALRNPLDTREEELKAVRTGSLYRNPPVVVSVKPKEKRPVPPPAPIVYSVEVIRGNKVETEKFQNQAQ
jgi:pilus assembly protein CpaB